MTLGVADLIMVRPLGLEATAAIGLARQVTILVERRSTIRRRPSLP